MSSEQRTTMGRSRKIPIPTAAEINLVSPPPPSSPPPSEPPAPVPARTPAPKMAAPPSDPPPAAAPTHERPLPTIVIQEGPPVGLPLPMMLTAIAAIILAGWFGIRTLRGRASSPPAPMPPARMPLVAQEPPTPAPVTPDVPLREPPRPTAPTRPEAPPPVASPEPIAEVEPSAPPSPTSDEWAEKGNALLKQGAFREALAAYEKSLRLDPKQPQVYQACATAFLATGDLPRALAACNHALQVAPQDPANYQLRGDVYRQQGEPDKAAADYYDMLRLTSRDFSRCGPDPDYEARERASIQQQLQEYTDVIANGTDQAKYYSGRGHLYLQLGELEKALADFDKAVRLVPDAGLPYADIGEAYLQRKDITKALEMSRRGMRQDPQEFGPVLVLADALYAKGEVRAAIANYEKAIVKYETDRTFADPHVSERIFGKLAEIYLLCPQERFRNAKKGRAALERAGQGHEELHVLISADEQDWLAAATWQFEVLGKTPPSKAPEVARLLATYLAKTKGSSRSWPQSSLRP